MKYKVTAKVFLIVSLVVSLVLITIEYNKTVKSKHINDILIRPAISNAEFIEFRSKKGSNYMGIYKFEVKETIFQGVTSGEGLRYNEQKLYKGTFPVIYNENDPQKNAILIFPSDFKDFKIPFPDSMSKWISLLD